MWFLTGDRRSFLELIQRRRSPELLNPERIDHLPAGEPKTDKLWLLWWKDAPARATLPEAIVVAQHQVSDFLAWTGTYLEAFRPVTSMCRVLDAEHARQLVAPAPVPIDPELQTAAIGGVLGEALEMRSLSLTEPRSEGIADISLRGCLNTCMFTVIRALTLGVASQEYVVERWLQMRDAARASVSRSRVSVFADASLQVAALMAPASSRPQKSRIFDALVQLRSQGEVGRELVLELSNGDDVMTGALLTDDREQRFGAFESAFEMFRRRPAAGNTAAFLLGYLLSRVAPSTFEHAGVVTQGYVRQMPGILPWYGICSGLTKDTEVLSQGAGLARRIARELDGIEVLCQRPRCDLAMDELRVWTAIARGPAFLRGADPGRLVVEVVPGVTAVVPWATAGQHGQRSLFDLDERGHESEGDRRAGDGRAGPLAARLRALASEVEALGGPQVAAGTAPTKEQDRRPRTRTKSRRSTREDDAVEQFNAEGLLAYLSRSHERGAGPDGTTSNAQIANRFALDLDTATAGLRRLEQAGIIRQTADHGGGIYSFTLLLPLDAALDEAKALGLGDPDPATERGR